jgi:SAM-dependent methyltransferase
VNTAEAAPAIVASRRATTLSQSWTTCSRGPTQRDVVQGIPGAFDLITLLDVLHEMPRPVDALASILRALAPGGTCFILEFKLFGDLSGNIDHHLGIGAFGYSASLNYCMMQALAVGGVGTGACTGEERLRAFAAEAGFSRVARFEFPNNPFNTLYALQP